MRRLDNRIAEAGEVLEEEQDERLENLDEILQRKSRGSEGESRVLDGLESHHRVEADDGRLRPRGSVNPEDAVDSIQVAAWKGNNGELSQSRDGMG